MVNVDKIKALFAPKTVFLISDYDNSNYAVGFHGDESKEQLTNNFALVEKSTGNIKLFNPLFHMDEFNKAKVVYKA